MNTINILRIKVKEAFRIRTVDKTAGYYIKLKEEIARDGMTEPVTLSQTNHLIDGLCRLSIAKDLGITEIPFTRPGD